MMQIITKKKISLDVDNTGFIDVSSFSKAAIEKDAAARDIFDDFSKRIPCEDVNMQYFYMTEPIN